MDVYTHHSFTTCDECGAKHYPGNKDACIATLQIKIKELEEEIRRLNRELDETICLCNRSFV